MHTVVEHGFLVHRAVESADHATSFETDHVFDIPVELEADVDGATHNEVHLFDFFDGFVDYNT